MAVLFLIAFILLILVLNMFVLIWFDSRLFKVEFDIQNIITRLEDNHNGEI
jgi:hypothetical protein